MLPHRAKDTIFPTPRIRRQNPERERLLRPYCLCASGPTRECPPYSTPEYHILQCPRLDQLVGAPREIRKCTAMLESPRNVLAPARRYPTSLGNSTPFRRGPILSLLVGTQTTGSFSCGENALFGYQFLQRLLFSSHSGHKMAQQAHAYFFRVNLMPDEQTTYSRD